MTIKDIAELARSRPMIDLTPVLITIKNGTVDTAVIQKNALDLEKSFKEEVEQYGVEPCDVDFDNGYIELECGTTICMTWADSLSNAGSEVSE